MAILKALRIYCIAYQHSLTMESNLFNAISSIKFFKGPWKMQFYFHEICWVSFQHASKSANGMADSLVKEGGVRHCNLSASIL